QRDARARQCHGGLPRPAESRVDMDQEHATAAPLAHLRAAVDLFARPPPALLADWNARPGAQRQALGPCGPSVRLRRSPAHPAERRRDGGPGAVDGTALARAQAGREGTRQCAMILPTSRVYPSSGTLPMT